MKTPKTLTDDECFLLSTHMLQGFGNPIKKPRALRNHTMMILMLDAGLRVGEVVKLLVHDLIIHSVPVTNLLISREIAKRHHERCIPLTARIRSNIDMMNDLCWMARGVTPNPFAFSLRGVHKPLSRRQVERIIKRAAIESISRPIHPHVLRHTFASKLMRRTSMRIVQELLGHTNIRTTQIYTHPNGNDLKEAIESLNKPERQVT